MIKMSWLILKAEHQIFREIFVFDFRSIVMIIALSLVTGCLSPPKPKMTPLQIQSLQSRQYESSKNIVFASVISVFQDLGYTITNANKDTGLIYAESAAKSDGMMSDLLGVGFGNILGFTEVSQTKATSFIETIGNGTRVRLNFVEIKKTSSEQGQSDRQDSPILDGKIYQNAFERIDSAIFIRTN